MIFLNLMIMIFVRIYDLGFYFVKSFDYDFDADFYDSF